MNESDVLTVAVVALAIALLAVLGTLIIILVGRERVRWRLEFERDLRHRFDEVDDEKGDESP